MTGVWRLLGDVGGTNVRFGLVAEDAAQEIVNVQAWPSDRFDGFEAALDAYLATLGEGVGIAAAAIAAAGPATAEAIKLTNRDWTISRQGLCRTVGREIPIRLLNDLEAVAHALPFLEGEAIEWWDDRRPQMPAAGRRLAVNVGTGFGAAAIIEAGGRWVCCPGEAGHMHLGAADPAELELLRGFGGEHATVESVLSGAGVQRLAASHGAATALAHAFDFAAPGPEMDATRAVFARLLARTAANLVLATAAWDGVYLTGSVALAWAEHADRPAFRDAFVGGGAMRDRLAATPVAIIRAPDPALIGLANVAMA